MKNSISYNISYDIKTSETENYDSNYLKDMISTIKFKFKSVQMPNFKFSGYCHDALRKIKNFASEFSCDENQLNIKW